MRHNNCSLSLFVEKGLYAREEADVIIISYLLAQQGCYHMQVLADDTNTFVLVLFFCWNKICPCDNEEV